MTPVQNPVVLLFLPLTVSSGVNNVDLSLPPLREPRNVVSGDVMGWLCAVLTRDNQQDKVLYERACADWYSACSASGLLSVVDGYGGSLWHAVMSPHASSVACRSRRWVRMNGVQVDTSVKIHDMIQMWNEPAIMSLDERSSCSMWTMMQQVPRLGAHLPPELKGCCIVPRAVCYSLWLRAASLLTTGGTELLDMHYHPKDGSLGVADLIGVRKEVKE